LSQSARILLIKIIFECGINCVKVVLVSLEVDCKVIVFLIRQSTCSPLPSASDRLLPVTTSGLPGKILHCQSHPLISVAPGLSSTEALGRMTCFFQDCALAHIALREEREPAARALKLEASAYECQFKGSMTFFPATDVWKANTEHKCKFFAWIILHNKALTVDNMLKKKRDCDPMCSLCFCIRKKCLRLRGRRTLLA
jgi:hypothetical protein